jgi:uncharacterized protein
MSESSPRHPVFVRAVDGGIELAVKVVPGSSRSGIAGTLGNRLKLRVAEPAEGGRANRAVIALVSRWLAVKDVEIVSGHGQPEKSVRVRGITAIPPEALDVLRR